jgi:transposase
MAYIEGDNRDQLILIAESLDGYVAKDNPVRFIDAFVDSLDLVKLGFEHATTERKGRPPYHPAVLLKLYLYGYLNKVRTTRDLEKQTHCNIEVIWLLGRLRPDFKTIADFRKNNLSPLNGVHLEFAKLCLKAGLYGREIVAVDGSKFKGVNAKDRNYNERSLKEKIAKLNSSMEKWLKQLDENDKTDPEPPKFTAEEIQQKIEELKRQRQEKEKLLEDLKDSGDTQISSTDPDSKALHTSNGTMVGYNVQVAVDAKHKLIAALEVTNSRSDTCELSKIASKAKEALGVESLEIVADRGYFNTDEIKRCETLSIKPYISKPDRTKQRPNHFDSSKFIYDAATDSYRCPADETLNYRSTIKKKKGPIVRSYANISACLNCRLKSLCTPARWGRRIIRSNDQEVLDRMADRIRTNPEKIRARSSIIEHVFGTVKSVMNQGYFLMKRFEKVTAEMSLTALAYNLKRAMSIIGPTALIQVLR